MDNLNAYAVDVRYPDDYYMPSKEEVVSAVKVEFVDRNRSPVKPALPVLHDNLASCACDFKPFFSVTNYREDRI
jgi:hypothetical protein